MEGVDENWSERNSRGKNKTRIDCNLEIIRKKKEKYIYVSLKIVQDVGIEYYDKQFWE